MKNKSSFGMTLAMIVTVALLMLIRTSAEAQELSLTAGRHPQHYTLTDLGTLGGTFSWGSGINDRGWVAGKSSIPADQIVHAFLWRNGELTDLGTLGGANSYPAFSPFSGNGSVGGGAETSAPDPNGEDFCMDGSGLTCRPVLWQDGVITVLPTLGGNNGAANQVNNQGQVVGVAETETLPPACLGGGLAEPVVWDNGQIQDLHVFPGDSVGVALAINDWGDAVGFSASCRSFHALLWQDTTITDLGSLGGMSGIVATAINNRGQIVGGSDLLGDTTSHAFQWQKGKMTDLGTLPGDFSSSALGINGKGQVVGVSSDINNNTRAVLWERGVLSDLNTRIPAGSMWFLLEADAINSSGQIVGGGIVQTSTGPAIHAFLATPCEAENADVAGCNDRKGTTEQSASQRPNDATLAHIRRMLRQRPGFGYLQAR
jgi:probable HAF family extracellular repeat protein